MTSLAAASCLKCSIGLLKTPVVSVLFREVPSPAWRLTFAATIRVPVKNLQPPPKFNDVEFPPGRRRLKILDKVPQNHININLKAPKMSKRIIDMRGPELVHNQLLHKQYGIRATTGGQLKWGHIEMIRMYTTRKIDDNKMFAIWRIPSPWKPLTKKGQGHRMGSGKGSISEYVVPVKSGRVIVELGGNCEFAEVQPILKILAAKLPFKAEVISQEVLEEEARQQKFMEENNINPFSFKYCLENNFMGIQKWVSPYDYIWHGKYR